VKEPVKTTELGLSVNPPGGALTEHSCLGQGFAQDANWRQPSDTTERSLYRKSGGIQLSGLQSSHPSHHTFQLGQQWLLLKIFIGQIGPKSWLPVSSARRPLYS
jgi:hypothetical protein